MHKVKNLVAAGASLSDAVRSALGEKTLAQFAEQYGVNRTNISSGLNGHRTLNDGEVDALVRELGGTPADWRELLWLEAKPAK